MPSNLFPCIALTPEPPYYAVIFTSFLKNIGDAAYEAEASRMLELVQDQPGFLGVESYRDGDGAGVTISYWRDLEAIAAWRNNQEHQAVQKNGQLKWYQCYSIRICCVERDYTWFHGVEDREDKISSHSEKS